MKPNCFRLRLDRSKMKSSGGQRLEETSNSVILQGEETSPNLTLKLRPLKNGYYRVQMGLARDILSSVLLQEKQLNRVLYPNWCLYFGFKWESWLTLYDGSIT